MMIMMLMMVLMYWASEYHPPNHGDVYSLANGPGVRGERGGAELYNERGRGEGQNRQ